MLYVVGFGSGSRENMTLEAEKIILKSDIIVGYTAYTDILKKYFPDKEYYSTGMRQERERVIYALENSRKKTVSLVCSGDSSVYGMAGLAIELSVNYPDVDIEIISGVTSALSGGAVLGSPLGHDFTVISLSDLLTPWDKIIKRIEYASISDCAIVIYNPSSKKRADYLSRACDMIMMYRNPDTICGTVRNIGREGQESRILTLSELKNTAVDMFTTVFIGNSETKVINGRMVTPRGYKINE